MKEQNRAIPLCKSRDRLAKYLGIVFLLIKFQSIYKAIGKAL